MQNNGISYQHDHNEFFFHGCYRAKLEENKFNVMRQDNH